MGTSIKLIAFDRASAADVLRLALPISLTDFALKHGFTKAEVSQCLSGYRPHEKVRAKIAEELGVPRSDVDSLLGEAAA